MRRVVILKGLPASGKTTIAKELCKKNYKRINKDDLRSMLDDGKWSGKNEVLVIACRDALIASALMHRHDVVIDDTNLDPKHEIKIRQFVGDKAEIKVKFIDTPLDECIKRDSKREKPVGEKVIRDMYEKYLKPKEEPKKKEVNPNLPKAIMCDLDGTLASMVGRSPFDWSRVGEDDVNEFLLEQLKELSKKYVIILASGRDEGQCRKITEEWLKRHSVPYTHLYMRPSDDSRRDDIVKEEIYRKNIEGKYNVVVVFDDRNRVVQKWREMGLTCYQVAEGNF